ncbi:universal stress protein [Vibrio alginolyticus]|uniref:universal stress protein n=1 Tax=Vibrio alginolyticus TaxID=663 RepID=UPI001D279B9B|nr:universal stress protein [Vibrio alginolyticus]EHA1097525.1 universal stress protein [Vibrio alginolyticus]EHA1119622.1 universal stress protein [Vibrio alginolyticus]MCQ9058777.1 universal stress protein [Vibrio alginolyticus]
MKRFANILFATQGLPGHSDALEQAMRIASSNKVPVSGLIACPDFPTDMIQYQQSYEQSLQDSLKQSIHEYRQKLGLTEEDLAFPLTVKSSEKPAVCIIQEALADNKDLIIKEAEPLGEGAEGFKAIDMTLLRKCPCPLWLHRPIDKPRDKRRVAVAIDPLTASDEQHSLAVRLLELSRSIADTCDSRLHVISCWEYYLENYLNGNAWIQVDDAELKHELNKAKADHKQALQQLLEESGITGEIVIHHLHGKPDEKIPDYVESIEVDVLVMGTLARTGISGYVIGNTAENILQSINCSLVALKPDGFVSPIQ